MRKKLQKVIGVLILATFASVSPSFAAEEKKEEEKIENLSPEKTLERADSYIFNERLEEAFGLLKNLEATTPKISARIDVLVGKIYLRLNKPSKAMKIFEDVNFRTLDDSETFLGMAKASLAMGKITQARTHAMTALRSDPDLIEAELVVARADDLTGKIYEAGKRFQKLIDLQPENEIAHTGYATFLADRIEIDEGIDLLTRYVDRHPLAAEANDLLGQMHWRLGNKREALAYRAVALKTFAEAGNEYRAKGIAVWLDGHGSASGLTRPPSSKSKKNNQARPPAMALARPEPLPIPQGVSYGQGSGFVIADGRYVVTNRHVIEGGSSVLVRNGIGEVRKARIVAIAKNDDLAILELEKPFPDIYSIPFANMIDPRPGRGAVVMGYPMASTLGASYPALTEGIVSKITGLGEQPTIFQLTSKLNKGNSGGPVFDRRGNLIGVAVAKLDTTGYFEKRGYLPEDVNLAIKISRVLTLLDQQPMGDVPKDTRKLELEELYQEMLPRVVLIITILDEG